MLAARRALGYSACPAGPYVRSPPPPPPGETPQLLWRTAIRPRARRGPQGQLLRRLPSVGELSGRPAPPGLAETHAFPSPRRPRSPPGLPGLPAVASLHSPPGPPGMLSPTALSGRPEMRTAIALSPRPEPPVPPKPPSPRELPRLQDLAGPRRARLRSPPRRNSGARSPTRTCARSSSSCARPTPRRSAASSTRTPSSS